MKGRLQKCWVISTVVLMGLTTTLPSVNMVLAETVYETQNAEAQEVTLPYDNLLEAPTSAYSESQEEPTVEEALTFSLEKEAVAGTVGETTDVVIHVDRPTDQVQVTIPQELNVQQDELSEGIEATQMTETEWWFTADERTKFTIPVSSETAGKFTIRVEDELDGTIDFEETEEDETNDKAVVTDSTDNTNEPEDSAISEVQGEEETPTQETEDITPATTSNVSTWAQFRTAINTTSVTEINILDDISGDTSLSNITRNLTINGNGFTINTQNQRFRVINTNRRFTMRNLTLIGNTNPIRIGSGATNATFVFSDFTYGGSSTVIATEINNGRGNVIFDGGVSNFSSGSSGEHVFAGISDVQLINNAVVNSENRVFLRPIATDSVATHNGMKLTVDIGSHLIASSESNVVFASTIDIQGNVILKATDSSSFVSTAKGTQPLRLTLGNESNVYVEQRNSSVPLIELQNNVGLEMSIANGSEFDLINSDGGPILNNTRVSNLRIITENLAVWDRGQVSGAPSHNYENIEAQLTGVNAATIVSTNNEEFRSTYSAQGLNGYSRISSSGKAEPEELTLELIASPTEGGNPSAGNTSLAEGSTTTISANPNSGYNFVRWEIVSGAGNIANATLANTTFTMGASNTVVRAVYNPVATTFSNTVTSNPFIGGRVRVGTGQFTTTTSFSASANGQAVITAEPNLGYQFVDWTLATPGTASFEDASNTTTTVTVFSQSGIRANFEPIPEYQLRLEASPADGGTPSAADTSLTEGSTTTISANPNSGYDFVRWEIISGNGRIESPISETTSFTMGTADTVLQAVFEVEKPSIVDPLDPLDPEVEVNPENRPELPEDQGLLSIDFVSQFDFGKQPMSAKEKTYYAKPQRLLDESGNVLENEERPNYVQVSDRRSSTERIGWRLSVTQDKQFSDMNGNELTGAQIQFENQQLVSPQDGNSPTLKQPEEVPLIPGEKQVLLNAHEESGTGTWIYRFGDSDSANESVSLTVPSGAVSQASAYNTTFVWELNSVPENSDH